MPASRLLPVNGLILGTITMLQVNLDVLGYYFGLGPTGAVIRRNLIHRPSILSSATVALKP